jgi:hypothetical protein
VPPVPVTTPDGPLPMGVPDADALDALAVEDPVDDSAEAVAGGFGTYFHKLTPPFCASARATRFSWNGHAATLFERPPPVGVGTRSSSSEI